jgi:hypothetical protein
MGTNHLCVTSLPHTATHPRHDTLAPLAQGLVGYTRAHGVLRPLPVTKPKTCTHMYTTALRIMQPTPPLADGALKMQRLPKTGSTIQCGTIRYSPVQEAALVYNQQYSNRRPGFRGLWLVEFSGQGGPSWCAGGGTVGRLKLKLVNQHPKGYRIRHDAHRWDFHPS